MIYVILSWVSQFRARNLVPSFKYEAQSPWVKGEVSGDEAKRNASLSFSLHRKAEYTVGIHVYIVVTQRMYTPAADFPRAKKLKKRKKKNSKKNLYKFSKRIRLSLK